MQTVRLHLISTEGATHVLMFSRITPRQVVARMSKGERVAFVDARGDQARRTAGVRLTGAVPVHLATLVRDATQIPQHCLTVVYGDDDGALDVPRIAEELRMLGFGEVRILAGGFAGWLELSYPVQSADEAVAAA